MDAVLPHATPPPPPPPPPPPAAGGRDAGPIDLPEQFGRYRILRRLGSGGMGSVFLAYDAQLDRRVALKSPHVAAGARPEVLERFLREARAAATLDHPNICPVYDAGVQGGVPYVIMAHIEGRTLSDLARGEAPLPQRPVADLVRKLAAALAEAHRRGVVHRDVKPSNVLVNARHEPVLVDFGLARRTDDAHLTRAGAVVGTPAYMAPEQLRGDPEAVGPHSDIYSLGVALYELLAGRPPFQGPAVAVVAQRLTQPPPDLESLRPDVDPALAAVCRKAMAEAPEDRFATMDDFAAALGDFLQGGSAGAPSAAAADSTTAEGAATRLLARLAERLDATAVLPVPARGRGRAWLVAALAGVVVVVAAAVAAVLLLGPGRRPDGLRPVGDVVIPLPQPPQTSDPAPRAAGDPQSEPDAPRAAGDSLRESPPVAALPPVQAVPPPAAPLPDIQALIDQLGDPDGRLRRQAAEGLRRKKDAAAVLALIARVADDLWDDADQYRDPTLSSKAAALAALRELAPERVTEALLLALRSAHAEAVRAWACEGLGRQKDPDAADALADAVGGEASARVRAAAAAALGDVHPPNVAVLAGALQDKDDLVRRRAAFALQQLGDRTKVRPREADLVAAGASDALVGCVADDLWTERDRYADYDGYKRAALAALAVVAPERVTGALVRALGSARVEDVRAWACGELGKQKDAESAAALLGALANDPSGKVRAAAAAALGGVHPPCAAALVRALTDADGLVRCRAARSLGALADPAKASPAEVEQVTTAATEPLIRRVADDAWDDLDRYHTGDDGDSSKRAAVATLRRLAPDRVTEALLLALRSSGNENVRAWACGELGKQKDPAAAEALALAASDPSERVREAAEAALKKRP